MRPGGHVFYQESRSSASIIRNFHDAVDGQAGCQRKCKVFNAVDAFNRSILIWPFASGSASYVSQISFVSSRSSSQFTISRHAFSSFASSNFQLRIGRDVLKDRLGPGRPPSHAEWARTPSQDLDIDALR